MIRETRALAWYFGVPGAGKTTLATHHAADLIRKTGWPLLCLNTIGAAQLRGIPMAPSALAAATRVFRRGEHAACIPRDQGEVDALISGAMERGRVVLFIDEAASWIDAHDRHSPILQAMRGHRHFRVALLLTTQHMSGDCPQESLSCAPLLHVFRCTSDAVLERLKKSHGIEPARVKALPRGQYFRIETGFPDVERGQL